MLRNTLKKQCWCIQMQVKALPCEAQAIYEKSALVCFDEDLVRASQAAFSESIIHGQKQTSFVSMGLFAHPGLRLIKAGRNNIKHQTQQLVMMASEMISTRTLQYPSLEQMAATHDLLHHS